MPDNHPEGTVADVDGVPYVKRGGRWVRQGAQQQPGGIVFGQRPAYEVAQDQRAERQDARAEDASQLDRQRFDLAVRADERAQAEADAKRMAAEAEAADKAAKLRAASESERVKVEGLLGTIQHARGLVGPGEVGMFGPYAANIGGTRARDLRAAIETLQANLSFDKLAEMRRNSPTGGALGAVSERELTLLGAAVASLDQGQSEEAFRDSLAKVDKHYRAYLASLQPAEPPTPRPTAQERAARRSRATPEEMAFYNDRIIGKPAPPRRGTGVGANVRLGDGTAPARRPAPRRAAAPAKPIEQMSDEELARLAGGR